MEKYNVSKIWILKKENEIFVCEYNTITHNYKEVLTNKIIKIKDFERVSLINYYPIILENINGLNKELIAKLIYKYETEITITNYCKINDLEKLNKKLNRIKIANINVYPKDKKCLFIMGMLFAKGIKIRILNKNELDLKDANKSFSMMPYVWSKFSEDKIKIDKEMDVRIENIKRLGVEVKPILTSEIKNKIFLICPVRNATIEQKKWIENFVMEKEKNGYLVHAPHLHTNQNDMFGGYAVCRQNAEALSSSSEVDIYYDQKSTGSAFDLGVAFVLEKPLKVLNKEDIIFNLNDFIDNIIINWSYKNFSFSKQNKKVLIKSKKSSFK